MVWLNMLKNVMPLWLALPTRNSHSVTPGQVFAIKCEEILWAGAKRDASIWIIVKSLSRWDFRLCMVRISWYPHCWLCINMYQHVSTVDFLFSLADWIHLNPFFPIDPKVVGCIAGLRRWAKMVYLKLVTHDGSMVLLYVVTFTINIPPKLVYIPYMDPMGYESQYSQVTWPSWRDDRKISAKSLGKQKPMTARGGSCIDWTKTVAWNKIMNLYVSNSGFCNIL